MIIVLLLVTGIINYMNIGLINHNNDYALIINSQNIPRFQFERSVSWTQNQQQQLLGDRYIELSTDTHYIHQLRKQVLSQMINQLLLQQYVHNLGINISDNQIIQVISSQLQFQLNGHFDFIKYKSYLNVTGLTSRQYAEIIRDQLIMQQFLSVIGNSEFILPSDQDQKILTLLFTQQRQIRTTVVKKSFKMNFSVSTSEIRNYYYQNIRRFINPELFRFDYIPLNDSKINLSQLQTIKESQIKHWYDLHQQDYIQSSRYKYRVIQVDRKKLAQIILQKLKNGADFITLARDNSVDPISAHKGGELPWMELEYTPVELKNAHLQYKGQISGIIKSSVGYLIVRLDDIQPAQIMPFNKVRSIIINKLYKKHMIDNSLIIKEKIQQAMDQQLSIKQIEKITGIKSVDTGWFSRNNIPKYLTANPIIQVVLKNHQLSSKKNYLINSDHGNFVIRIRQYRPAVLIPLRHVKNSISLYITRKKTEHQNKVDAKQLLSALKTGISEQTLNLHFINSRLMTRELTDSIIPAVFSIDPPKKNHVSYGLGKDRQGNILIIAVDKIMHIIPSKEQKAVIDTIIRHVHFEAILTALLDNLRQNNNIRYGTGIIDVMS